MFLNEDMYLTEMSADPMDCMALYAETVEEIAKIELAQARAEHSAIMSEDSYMLNEALEEAKDKVTQVVADAKARLLEFIDKVKEKWTQVQATINSTLLRQGKINKIIANLGKLKGGKKNFLTTAKHELFDGKDEASYIVELMNEINTTYAKDLDENKVTSSFNTIYKKLSTVLFTDDSKDNMSSYFREKNRDVDQSAKGSYATIKEASTAAAFLQKRPAAIKGISKVRQVVASYKGRAEKTKIKECQKVLSAMTNYVNKMTNEAVKLLRDAGKAAGTSGKKPSKLVGDNDAERANNIANGNYEESGSILADYGYYGY